MSKAKRNKSTAAPAPVKIVSAPLLIKNEPNNLKQFVFGSAVILLLVFVIYFPVINGEFLWDDLPVFIDHPIIISSHGLETIWIKTVWLTTDFPLTLTTFWLEHRLWGNDSTGYHVTNILLHALGAILLWRVLLLLKIRGAFLAALIFAVHPVCVASVAWISERKNTLSLVFFLLALLFYLRAEKPPRSGERGYGFYCLSLGAFFLALLSKTSIVALPVVLLGIVWWSNGKITARDFLRTIPFFLLAFGFGLLTIYSQTHNAIRGEIVQTETFPARLAESAWAVWFYLWKSLVPTNLSAIYPHWELRKVLFISLLPLAALAGILFFFWQKRKSWGRHWLLALGYFVVMLFPVLGFIDMYFLIFSRVADQWQYVPLIGIIVFVVAGISYLLEKKFNVALNTKIGLATVVVLLLCVLTWNHAKVYASEEKLWSDTIKKNPKAWMAYNNLGRILYSQGKIEESIRLFSDSLRMKGNHAETHNNFGLALTEQGKLDQAVAEFLEAIRIKPAQPKFHFNLGIALAKQGKSEAAISAYSEALKLSPNYADVHNNLSSVLNKVGRNDESLQHSLRALQIKPNFPEAHYNAANAFVALGKMAEAAEHFSAALKLRPNFASVHYDWGVALAMQGKLDEAAQHFSELVRQNPNDSIAHNFLGNALAGQKKFDEAILHYETSLRIEPNVAQTHNNLGNALNTLGKFDEAIAHYNTALKLEPDYPEGHFNLGLALVKVKKPSEAKAQFAEALRLKPDYAAAKRELDLLGASTK